MNRLPGLENKGLMDACRRFVGALVGSTLQERQEAFKLIQEVVKQAYGEKILLKAQEVIRNAYVDRLVGMGNQGLGYTTGASERSYPFSVRDSSRFRRTTGSDERFARRTWLSKAVTNT